MLSTHTIETVKSTIPILEAHGLDITKNFYQRLFINHPELQHIFNMSNQKNEEQQQVLANAVFAYANHIDNLEPIFPIVRKIANRHASIGILPEHYPIIGENLLGAIQDVAGLPDGHVVLSAWGEAYGILADVLISAEEKIYHDNESKDGGWRGYKPFVIDKIVSENLEVRSFYLKPADDDSIVTYKAGQYISIKVDGAEAGQTYDAIRQYSLSDQHQDRYYRITVKTRSKGVVSGHLHKAEVGQRLAISTPTGLFTLVPNKSSHIFISGGVGITPLYSMLKEALAEGIDPKHIQFISCVHDEQLQIFHDELVALQSQYRFDYKRAFEFGDGADAQGYLTAEIVDQWLIDKSAEIYFCGPKPFMSALNQILLQIGVKGEQLHYEIFGTTTGI